MVLSEGGFQSQQPVYSYADGAGTGRIEGEGLSVKKIVIVEDEPFMREELEQIFQKAGKISPTGGCCLNVSMLQCETYR